MLELWPKFVLTNGILEVKMGMEILLVGCEKDYNHEISAALLNIIFEHLQVL